jgi:alpha-galactosidase
MSKSSVTQNVGPHSLTIEGEFGEFQAAIAGRPAGDDIWLITLSLSSARPAVPHGEIKIIWKAPLLRAHGLWHSNIRSNRSLCLDDYARLTSRATNQAPLICAFDEAGRNVMTYACADALHTIQSHAFAAPPGFLELNIVPFRRPMEAAARHEVVIRIDTRKLPYQTVLADFATWWENQDGYAPAPVPEHARLPMYSTWYSFLQKLDADAILRECRIAKEIGCESIIVDDGWQPVDEIMGYRHCGDWDPVNIPDMPGFVQSVHDTGLKFLLWYGTPLIGWASRAYERYKHMMLYDLHWTPCSVFDPRYTEMREYLIGKLEQQTRDWKLDGLKLDFVDLFVPPEKSHPLAAATGRDFEGVPEAGDHLLTQIMQRLRAIRPDVMIEFRQWYTGPLMRKYGNMLRAADCPDCYINNRIRTLDIRLLGGKTPAHSDMLEWNINASPEYAAMQLIHVLFSVPQISVLLDKAPRAHLEMLRFWLGFWRENRDVLLDGTLEPLSPEFLYPVVRASTPAKRVVAVYANTLANIGTRVPAQLMVVNGTQQTHVTLEVDEPLASRRLRVFSTTGVCVEEKSIRLTAGLHRVPVPAAGLLRIDSE